MAAYIKLTIVWNLAVRYKEPDIIPFGIVVLSPVLIQERQASLDVSDALWHFYQSVEVIVQGYLEGGLLKHMFDNS